MVTRVRRRSRARRGDGELLRDEIIAATEKLLLETGDADAVSIRAVAEAVGVTPPSIYMHFSNKEELILDVCESQFQALSEFTRKATKGIVDPAEQVKAMGRAYVHFGLEHPEQYRFLFMTRPPDWQGGLIRERIMDISGFGSVVEAAQRCIDAGAFKAGDAFTTACVLWTGVHGLTSLLIAKPEFPWPDRDALIDACLDSMSKGLSI